MGHSETFNLLVGSSFTSSEHSKFVYNLMTEPSFDEIWRKKFPTYISINIEPNGKIPPDMIIIKGSMNHFFSGMGLGTAFTLHG